MAAREQTHWWYVGMRALASALLDEIAVPAAGRDLAILDAGCGTGGSLIWLARYGRVTGLDLSPTALAFCRKRQLRRLVGGSIEQLPFPDATFDLVTTFDVLYHRWVADDARALRELHRVLRPGGWLLLRVPALPWLAGRHDNAVHTRHRYRRAEVVALLTAAGFAVRRATYVNVLLFPLVAGKRLLERWITAAPTDLDATPDWLNPILARVLMLERRMLRVWTPPLGVSILALARRPDAPACHQPADSRAWRDGEPDRTHEQAITHR